MKIVVVDNPKFWSFFLRKMFKIKKLPKGQNEQSLSM